MSLRATSLVIWDAPEIQTANQGSRASRPASGIERGQSGSVRFWTRGLLVASAVLLTASLSACSTPTGVVTGSAVLCLAKGPGQHSHLPVNVTLERGTQVVATHTLRGPQYSFRFEAPAGKYAITSNQYWAGNIRVTIKAGSVAALSLVNLCK